MELRAENLRVTAGRREILRGVDFAARAGEVAVIAGPNGSGKTTLLRALTGEIAHGGRVALNGRDCAALRPAELALLRAVLPQAAALSFPFTALEVVRLGLTAGVPGTRAATGRLPAMALARVGLAGFEGRHFHDLSGGEKQRVQLARVLVQIWEPVLDGAPRWLFLDEPVSALDIGHQLQVMAIARDYARAGGGVVAVLHDLNLTAMHADRVTLLDGGRVRSAGTPAEVLTDATLSAAYHCRLRTNTPPPAGGPWILPQAADHCQEEAAE
ncbi:heme ABC transporter ATP-binding protein [Poseidonocella sp. HB161398]|uniref:heme ABC transporter ATP-binding protein n=1 Tax=Poseidonocella sp. HB161398 TaxID=2320855 RepID=UPI001109DE88|nr:heme ABC transporter ATP-binding protein [Poseidonocella sp. HB161398]